MKSFLLLSAKCRNSVLLLNVSSKNVVKAYHYQHIRFIASSSQVSTTSIHKLLIANRGEIACRIIRTAKKLGIQTVAVFSEADRHSLHVGLADEAHCIGPAASAESYLRQDKIIDVAKRTKSHAIHPGYGFLSENTEFADLCQAEGVIFVGPPSNAIRDMGIKSTAKRIMSDAGVPIVQGYHGEEQSDHRLKAESAKIGYPVMLKAVRGGGGKGMRIAKSEAEFDTQLESARREAMKSFGNDEMIVEKFVEKPRHVEVQVFGDTLGNYVYLFERDCSVQRRHQKIIEEAPAPGISEETRRSLGEAAVKAARAVNYVGAGTVEFIMDAEERFYFMEMNTRLQVEHPVTEMITNTDLVEWQLRVAQGEELPVTDQKDLSIDGHAVEARIYAEDPESGFMPAAGRLLHLRPPNPVPPYLRVETGVVEGDEVSVHYDPMISKLIVKGADRVSALRRLDSVLCGYHVVGLKTNVGFLRSLAAHPKFQQGLVYTDFIPDHKSELFPKIPDISDETLCQATAAVILKEMTAVIRRRDFNANDPFSLLDSYRVNLKHERTVTLLNGELEYGVKVVYEDDGCYTMRIGDREYSVSSELKSAEEGLCEIMEFECEIGSGIFKTKCVWQDSNRVTIFTKDGHTELGLAQAKWMQESIRQGGTSGGCVAPMPGVVEKVLVKPGDEVYPGQPLVVLVAMKMEYVIKSPGQEIVAQVLCAEGQSVAKNAVLIKFEESAEATVDKTSAVVS